MPTLPSMPPALRGRPVAPRLAALAEPFFAGPLPVRFRAWDGSEAGPAGAPVVVVRSRRALRRLLWAPGELGLAQAYVTGELDYEGELGAGLSAIWRLVQEQDLDARRPSPRELVRGAATLARLGAFGPRPEAPATQARLRGPLHSRRRDRAAIAHHYDQSTEFYALLLDPHLAYSCAYWASDDPAASLEEAQRDKLELVCRKLGLRPGMRFLDVGCGWGSLALYAAQHRGVRVVAVTLSKRQRDVVLARVGERGLAGRVEVRLQDYRGIHDGPFDAAAAIEMGEHVGREHYPLFAARLFELVRPEGRVLVQQMSRRRRPGGGDFIESFIAPDMHMRPLGETIELLEATGLEVRDVESLREHYGWTIRAWLDTLERQWDKVVALAGEELGRVWRLYLAGAALTFEEGRMGVDQILAVRPGPGGRSGMPRGRAGLAGEGAVTRC